VIDIDRWTKVVAKANIEQIERTMHRAGGL
jgi:hypothetical protein